MAEATDRPQGPPGQVPPDAVIAGADLGASPGTTTETYRPLSLLALAGFGLAVIYALVVLIGAAVALFNRVPWLMPVWTFLVPLAALVICWTARTRIRDAEGTLGGAAFTTWGMRLAILVSLPYAAYYLATFFAVRVDAVASANRFFALLKQEKYEQAFLLSLDNPNQNMDSAALRNMLESRFNSSQGAMGSPGGLSRFRQARFVRFLVMDGAKANIALRGVSDWGYDKMGDTRGYRVVLKYHIATTLAEFDLKLETFRRDSRPGQPKNRQWQVVLAGGQTGIVRESMNLTRHGVEVLDKKMPIAQQFATAWANKINQQEWDEAFLDTLKPSERPRLRKAMGLLAAAPLTGLAPLGLYEVADGDFLAGRQKLASGQLIRIEEQTFWAGKKQREAIRQRVRKTFQPSAAEKPAFQMTLQQAVPLVREREERATALFDVILRYFAENGEELQYVVEGQLVVTSEGPDADRSLSAWRIEAVDILSGRTPPPMPPRR